MGSNPRQTKEICGRLKYFFAFTQHSSMPCFERHSLLTAARATADRKRKQQFSTEKTQAIGEARQIQANNCHHIETVKIAEKPLQMACEAI
jgi:hypothetical protein